MVVLCVVAVVLFVIGINGSDSMFFLKILELIHCIAAIVSKLDFHRLIITEVLRYYYNYLLLQYWHLRGRLNCFPCRPNMSYEVEQIFNY